MKGRKITGFVLGLTGAIVGGFVGFYVSFIIGLAMALANGSGAIYDILSYLNLFGTVLCIIASCFYLPKTRVGGIIMLVGAMFNLSIYVYLLILGSEISAMLVLLMLPAVATLASGILGVTCKNPPRISPDINNPAQEN